MLKQRVIVDVMDDGVYYKLINKKVLDRVNADDDSVLVMDHADYWEEEWREAADMSEVLSALSEEE